MCITFAPSLKCRCEQDEIISNYRNSEWTRHKYGESQLLPCKKVREPLSFIMLMQENVIHIMAYANHSCSRTNQLLSNDHLVITIGTHRFPSDVTTSNCTVAELLSHSSMINYTITCTYSTIPQFRTQTNFENCFDILTKFLISLRFQFFIQLLQERSSWGKMH